MLWDFVLLAVAIAVGLVAASFLGGLFKSKTAAA